MRALIVSALVSCLLVVADFPSMAAIPKGWVIEGSQPAWIADFDGPAHGYEHADDVAVSPNGALVFVTGGTETKAGEWDWLTMAYDSASGARLWKARFDGEIARSIATGPGGRVFVTGEGVNLQGDERGVTVAYRARTGELLWSRRYAKADPAFDMDYVYARGIELGPHGHRVYVAGTRYVYPPGEPSGETRYAVWAYRATDGKRLWDRVVDRGQPSQVVNGMTLDPSGRLVLATGESGNGMGTLAIRAGDGTVAWFRRFHPHGGQNGIAVASSSRAVFVTGLDRAGTVTVAYGIDGGDPRWVARYGLDSESLGAQAQAIAVSPDGRSVAITGYWEGRATGDDEFATVLYAAGSGRMRWAASNPGPLGEAGGRDIMIPRSGDRVIATGYMRPYGILTVAYWIAGGGELWSSGAHDGEGKDGSGGAIAPSPDGSRVYLVATTAGGKDRQDFATFAYPA